MMERIRRILLLFIVSISVALGPISTTSMASDVLVAQMQEAAEAETEQTEENQKTNPVVIEDPDTPLGVDAVGLFQHSKWWIGIAVVLVACLITAFVEFYKKIMETSEEDE